MREHLIIKAMNFIGNQLIEVKLIPDPDYAVKEQVDNVDYVNIQGLVEDVSKLVNQKKELERIIYIGVDEWKTNNYNLASKIVLDINQGG